MARDDGGGDDDDGDGDVDECELDAVIARAFTSSDASTTEEATARWGIIGLTVKRLLQRRTSLPSLGIGC